MIARVSSLVLAAVLAGCQATGGTRTSSLDAGHRPSLDSDEAGLWMAADKFERAIRDSGRVVQDEATNRYVTAIVCRLAPDHCPQIRVSVIRTPNFNATMSPNGHMQVWTGLVLRTENEDQLAYVLGHEVAHFLRRHSVQRWRAIRATTDAASFFQILTAAAGVPVVGTVGSYAALGGLMAHSRDHEREADEDGLALVVRAGYDPRQAPLIWEALMAERKAEKEPEESVFFATHPSAEERVESLRRRAAESRRASTPTPDASTHERVLDRHAAEWLDDELTKREFAANLILVDRLSRSPRRAGLLAFYRGEIYRLRGEDGDDLRAISAYESAVARGGAPVAVHRSLGVMLWRRGRNAEARGAFEAYLAAAPEAEDRRMVASYLKQLGE